MQHMYGAKRKNTGLRRFHVPVGGPEKADAALGVRTNQADDDYGALLPLKAAARVYATVFVQTQRDACTERGEIVSGHVGRVLIWTKYVNEKSIEDFLPFHILTRKEPYIHRKQMEKKNSPV